MFLYVEFQVNEDTIFCMLYVPYSFDIVLFNNFVMSLGTKKILRKL